LESGLKDIPISRPKFKLPWGIDVPFDNTQVIYVWFDALNIYQSGIGFGWDEKLYQKWWPADLHVIGKGIIRFHAIYWPAFLLSAKLRLPKTIFTHGYLTIDGQKMSKTLGNVVDPISIIEKYGVDALRYYLLKEIPSTSDGDFSEKRLKEVYNADLANGLGNLVARVAKLCEKNEIRHSGKSETHQELKTFEHLKNFEFNLALEEIWKEIKSIDVKINADKPWSLSKEARVLLLTEIWQNDKVI